VEPYRFQHDGVSFRIDFHGNELGWEGRLFIEEHPTLQVVRVLNVCGASEDEARRAIVRGCEAIAATTPRPDIAKP
jgi:hypothetical protein